MTKQSWSTYGSAHHPFLSSNLSCKMFYKLSEVCEISFQETNLPLPMTSTRHQPFLGLHCLCSQIVGRGHRYVCLCSVSCPLQGTYKKSETLPMPDAADAQPHLICWPWPKGIESQAICSYTARARSPGLRLPTLSAPSVLHLEGIQTRL